MQVTNILVKKAYAVHIIYTQYHSKEQIMIHKIDLYFMFLCAWETETKSCLTYKLT